ncbi:type I pantothenate kinase [Bartonella sp. DGB1]|uniref:type I pantothenate kinase n=1 Tax=Bartonella sp. DGB1 TaxID=3239807 RepID=UPI003524DB64
MNDNSPFTRINSQDWLDLKKDVTLKISEKELSSLLSIGHNIEINEVKTTYLPLARLILSYFENAQQARKKQQSSIKTTNIKKVPFIIAISGSVAVGKSTMARLLQKLLSYYSPDFKIDLITSDGFLYPNKILESLNLMTRKGFPESYDVDSLLLFLDSIKSAHRYVKAPVYSHLIYDIVPNEYITVDCPDMMILEGINVLQLKSPIYSTKNGWRADLFDFSIYIDADEENVKQWYVKRFMKLRKIAADNPNSFFTKYLNWDEDKARLYATEIWEKINLKNLLEHIKPTQKRADLILYKEKNHKVKSINLRNFKGV